MLLYKYRSLKNFEYVLDIILNERLYCAPYDKLNDPFEGLFLSTLDIPNLPHMGIFKDQHGSLSFGAALLKAHASKNGTHQSIEDAVVEQDKIKICSLSSTFSDVRLWAHYGDGHHGIVFEIDFSEITNDIHEVLYSEKIPEFSRPPLVDPPVKASQILTRKTKHWEHEKEFRIIHDADYFHITDRIKSVYTGTRISDEHYALLKKVINNKFPIYRTTINKNDVSVEPVFSN